ncbi:MAG: GNAT family N-acetyltransferase [Streptosporangiaceae bacterium]
MTIRRAHPADASAVAVVHVRSWQAAFQNLISQDFLDRLDPDQRSERWQQSLAESVWPRCGVLVAEESGHVVGFARFCPSRDDDLDSEAVGEVAAIYLLPAAWGRGHGRRLMTEALAALGAAGYREAALWVFDANQRARGFYHKGGWAADGAVRQARWPDSDSESDSAVREVRYRHLLP